MLICSKINLFQNAPRLMIKDFALSITPQILQIDTDNQELFVKSSSIIFWHFR